MHRVPPPLQLLQLAQVGLVVVLHREHVPRPLVQLRAALLVLDMARLGLAGVVDEVEEGLLHVGRLGPQVGLEAVEGLGAAGRGRGHRTGRVT